MDIIALEKYPSSQRGGQELSLFDMCQGLATAGHKVSLLYGNPGDLVDCYQKFCDRVHPVNSLALSRQTLGRSLLSFLPDIIRVSRWIAQAETPILYCNQIYDILFPALLSTLTATPFACHLRLPPPQGLPKIYQWAIRCVDRFLTVSHHTRQQWIDFGIPPHKIATIHNGTNPEKFTPQAPNPVWLAQHNIPIDAQIIAYIGRLDRRKGVEILLSAIAQLRPQFPQLHLALAGKALLDGPRYQAKLEQLTEDLGIADIVHFLGHLADPSQLYTASQLTVIPSLWPEPFGKVVIESMACGTPVVASRTGGIPEILTGELAMGLCSPKDIDALSHTIAQMLTWPIDRPNFGKVSRNHILQNFTLDIAVQRLEQELQVTLEGDRTPALSAYSATVNHEI